MTTDTPPENTGVVVETTQTDQGPRPCSNACGCLVGCVCGCILIVFSIFLAIVTCIIFIYGIVLACQEYSNIPDCAHLYKAWMIVMIVLLAGATKGTCRNAAKKTGQDEGSPPSGAKDLCVAIFLGLIPLLSYLLVIRKTDENNCNLQPMDKIHQWSLYTIYYFIVLASAVVCRGILHVCCANQN